MMRQGIYHVIQFILAHEAAGHGTGTGDWDVGQTHGTKIWDWDMGRRAGICGIVKEEDRTREDAKQENERLQDREGRKGREPASQ